MKSNEEEKKIKETEIQEEKTTKEVKSKKSETSKKEQVKNEKQGKSVEKEEILEKNKKESEEVKNIKEEKYEIKGKDNKKTLTIILICSTVVIIALLFSTMFALCNINNSKIISNISVNGINISKLSKEEAKQQLLDKLSKNAEQNITAKTDDFEYQFQLSQIEIKYDVDKAVEDAYAIGRDGNIFKNRLQVKK